MRYMTTLFSHNNVNRFTKFEKPLKYFASAQPANFTVVWNIWVCTVNFSKKTLELAVFEGT
ncbi:hypothetical protein J6590_071780 [Homalodisca vitripennis]|nr:hypothetical protein J6590_071780 [Homalodisca vitripennis]